jgi:hypothetical protein
LESGGWTTGIEHTGFEKRPQETWGSGDVSSHGVETWSSRETGGQGDIVEFHRDTRDVVRDVRIVEVEETRRTIRVEERIGERGWRG